MARSMIDLEDELTRIWGLVGELSEQLNNNRALVAQLKARSENVKGQAAHVGTGFPLRRFNLDITNEEFHSELEGFASHLVLENQQLQHENKQLNALLKEYEQTLETVMGKFRGVAHTSQQHDLSLHSYYTSLLQTLQTAHSSAQLHDSASLSLLLHRLSTLLRSALRAMSGEASDELSAQLGGLLALTDAAGSASGSGSSGSTGGGLEEGVSPTSPGSSKSLPLNPQSMPRIPAQPVQPTRFPGFIPGTQGGYAGTEGQADWALEREYEIMRLEEENKALRELLAIAQEVPAASGQGEEGESEERAREEEGDEGHESGQRSRKSSLTVEELTQGAVIADERREAMGLAFGEREREGEEEAEGGGEGEGEGEGKSLSPRQEGLDGTIEGLMADNALTHTGTPSQLAGAAGAGAEGGEEQLKRPIMNESVLGFQATPPEEAVVDDVDNELGRES